VIIKRLDKSYRQRYQVSLIENSIRIKTVGVKQFVVEEKQKWTCSQCGGVISLHDRVCSECGWDMA
jgi:transposase